MSQPGFLTTETRRTRRKNVYAGGAKPDQIIEFRKFVFGQLFQMLMLARVVEGRLLGINLYGQPGVEMYKRNMIRILQD